MTLNTTLGENEKLISGNILESYALVVVSWSVQIEWRRERGHLPLQKKFSPLILPSKLVTNL